MQLSVVSLVIAALAPLVFGQSSGSSLSATKSNSAGAANPSASASLAALTPCVIGCLTAAAVDTPCSTFTNVTCACTNADFQFKATSCMQGECKAEELSAAVGIQQAQCSALSLSATAPPTATTPFLPSNSAADISVSGAASAPGSGGSPTSTSPSAGIPAASRPSIGVVTVFAVGLAVALGGAHVL
ncbi:CFEM domain-containing protein [Mycena indigotica]|uniref:CFEM domain-containing protein n=1 Tax=Mycena indigotica TaxID=2126181 RepID=A0A8H6SSX3_9AGAR|nr:CFEM domain-containing protein [Mycena indigotica]KAF7304106.1 CFEM domain-containing protein [Mycena indigotica]